MTGIQNVEVDRSGIMHDVGVVLASEDKPGSAHVRRQLVDLIERPVDQVPAKIGITQITDQEVVRGSLGIFVSLQIGTTYPHALRLQALHQMASDETSSSAHQRRSH